MKIYRKYVSRRRLYDPSTQTYVTIEQLLLEQQKGQLLAINNGKEDITDNALAAAALHVALRQLSESEQLRKAAIELIPLLQLSSVKKDQPVKLSAAERKAMRDQLYINSIHESYVASQKEGAQL